MSDQLPTNIQPRRVYCRNPECAHRLEVYTSNAPVPNCEWCGHTLFTVTTSALTGKPFVSTRGPLE